MKVMGYIGIGLIVVLVIAGGIVGGQQAGFWLKTNQTKFEAENLRNSYANQESLREDLARKAAEVNKIEVQIDELGTNNPEEIEKLEAQAEQIVAIACHDVGGMNELTSEARFFADDRCKGETE